MIEITPNSIKSMEKYNKSIPVTEDMLVNTTAAVRESIQYAQATWLEYISGTKVQWTGGAFVINRKSGRYQQAVMQGIRYPYSNNKFWGAIEVHLDYADIIERGIDTFSMKNKMLKGRPYINVPFEHEANKIPAAVAKNITSGRLRNIRIGNLLSFDVGKRTKTNENTGARPYTWRTGLYAGLASKGGSYMTFRRLSQTSPDGAWQFPDLESKPVSKAVESNITDKVNAMITAGFEQDIKGVE